MHIVYLSVTKSFLKAIIKQLRLTIIIQISKNIQNIAKHIACEFKRKPSGLNHVDRWKAKKFHLFLLYLAPCVLKSVLLESQYFHFMNLHFAIYILSSDQYNEYLECARACLNNFDKLPTTFYDDEIIVKSTHCLLNLSYFFELYGSLDLSKHQYIPVCKNSTSTSHKNVNLMVNIDCVPLFKSSGKSLWPIYVSDLEFK